MINENISYKRNKGLLVSVIRGKSDMVTIMKVINTEIKKGELQPIDIDNILDEIYVKSVKPFSPERDEVFQSLKNEIDNILDKSSDVLYD